MHLSGCRLAPSYLRMADKRSAMPFGLNAPYKRGNVVVLEFSSKVLRGSSLINSASIYDTWEFLGCTQHFQLPDFDTFLDSRVTICHVTSDIQSQRISQAVEELQGCSSTGRNGWNTSEIHKSHKGAFTSVSFHARAKSRPNQRYLTAYDKEAEMEKQSDYLNALTDSERTQALAEAKGIFRFELKLTRIGQIRKAFGDAPDTRLSTLLNAKTNPIHQTMEKIIKNAPTPTSAVRTDLKTFPIISTLERYQFDLNAIRSELRRISPANASREFKKYQRAYANLRYDGQGGELREQILQALAA